MDCRSLQQIGAASQEELADTILDTPFRSGRTRLDPIARIVIEHLEACGFERVLR